MRGRVLCFIASVVGLLWSMGPGVAGAGLPGGPNSPQPIVTFPSGSFPESFAVDSSGTYITLGFAGSLVRYSGGTTKVVASVDVGNSATLTGVVVTGGYAYFARAPFYRDSPAYLYRVPLTANDEKAEPWVTLAPSGSFPNGLAVRDGILYVADSAAGTIWAVSLGAHKVSTWCASDLLAPGRYGFGVNGIAFGRDGSLYADVSDFGRIVTVEGSPSGACSVTPVLTSQHLSSADGIAFGRDGQLYVTVNATNRLYAVDLLSGTLTTLADRSDGLSYPTQAAFVDAHTLYLTNGAIANGIPDLVALTLP